MRKLFSAFIFLSLTFGGIMAQSPAFFVGDKVVNAGIGLGSTYYTGGAYSTSIPPISFSYEQGIIDGVLDEGTIGVGGILGFSSYKWDWGNSFLGDQYSYKLTTINIGARGNFHYPLVDNLDTYTGLMIGVRIVNSKASGTYGANVSYLGGGGGFFDAWHRGASC
jgi:hypothetical protein